MLQTISVHCVRTVALSPRAPKDVCPPLTLPQGTVIPAMLEREDTNDVFISNKYKLSSLPADATIGSASLRRQAQLLSMYPRLQVVTFRGNVQTRLKKIDNGLVDGTLLALAGLKRLGMQELIDRSEIGEHLPVYACVLGAC